MRTDAAFECCAVFDFKDGQAGVEQLALGHDDDIEARRNLVSTKHLSNQSFSSIPCDRAPQLPGRGNAKAPDRPAVGQNEQRRVPPVNPSATLVDLLKLGAAANVFVGSKPSQIYSLLTVRRLRPFARRRLSTNRPFLVLIRTRKPCVRAR